MIPVEKLVDHVRTYNPNSNAKLITQAYEYGKEMHDGQTRHSGELYFTHPIEVALLLAQQNLDDSTIITALLHDVIEDTQATYRQVAQKFGVDVARLVDGVT